jgi:hypothetical protein
LAAELWQTSANEHDRQETLCRAMQGGDQCRQFLFLDVLELVLPGYFENYKIFVDLLNSIKIADPAIGATLRTAGNETTTGTDTVSSSITGASNAIVIGPGAATHFTLAAPASASGGIAFSFTVTALDQFDDVATGYGGTVHFTSGDSQATLPPDAPLTNRTGTFSATFRTPGSQTITATDTVNSAITGSPAISSVAAIPTLGTWSFLLLAVGLAAVAVRTLRLRVVACVDRATAGTTRWPRASLRSFLSPVVASWGRVSVPTTTWALVRTGDRKPDGGLAGRDR